MVGVGAQQAPAPVHKLTIAARTCPDYPDISANRRRNDAMESLRDLGPDSPYGPGALVAPVVEQPTHPRCRPLVGWKAQTGQGGGGKVDGLTVVSQPDAESPPTLSSTPELDDLGNPTGRDLPGAVTITLTAAQVERASTGGLVLQGGTATEPLLGGRIPGGGAFGALRCSDDNGDADNVELVRFPSGARHVFCFAYYVDAAVPAGTIVVRTQGAGSERYGFGGNVSYEPGGRFGLTVDQGEPASVSFRRAATRPGDPLWEVTEGELPAGWARQSVACMSRGGSSVALLGSTARIRLAGGDTVTCTYVNRRRS